jgi:hypothetical protein
LLDDTVDRDFGKDASQEGEVADGESLPHQVRVGESPPHLLERYRNIQVLETQRVTEAP